MSTAGTSVIVVAVTCLIAARGAVGAPPTPAHSTPVPSESAALPAGPLNPYVPPACTGVFTDVACPSGFAVNWIEKFYADGITAGCNAAPLEYCPDAAVTRAQMAVFVEKAMRGTGAWSPGDLGSYNTGLGAQALLSNSPYAVYNTAVGYEALSTQSFANGNSEYAASNTAVGTWSLVSNQPDGGNGGANGTGNTGVGVSSLFLNTTGYQNSAFGSNSGVGNTTGSGNTFLGDSAGPAAGDLVDATAVGFNSNVDASNHVRIGDTFVTQIGGQVGWSNLSDARAKNDVRDLDLGLDFVMQLRPVSFTMKQGNGRTDMGFVAQDVEALVGDGYNVLGIGGDQDRTLSLRYTDLIAPMVKAIQEQQAQLAAKDARIVALEADVRDLRVQVEALVAAQRPGDGRVQR